MAIALANDDGTNSIPRRTNGADATSSTCNAGGPSNNGTYTPGANSLLVAVIGVCGGSIDPDGSPPVAGHGLTYTLINSITTSVLGRTCIYAADSGSSPTSAALTVTYTTLQSGFCQYDLEFTGVDLSSGVAAAFVQDEFNSTASGTSLSVTLAAAGDAANRPCTFCYIAANEVITEDASYAEIHDQGHSAENRRLSASFQAGGFDTTVVHSWTTATQAAVWAFELKAAGGGGGAAVTLDPFGMTGFFGA